MLCLLLAATHSTLPSPHTRVAPRVERSLVSRSLLPLAALAPLSGALANADGSYRVERSYGGLRASNPSQRLVINFARSSIQLSAHGIGVGLGLRAVGYGDALRAVGAGTVSMRGNRALYARGGLDESYVNGPAGLEQGFTLLRAPSGHPRGPLTLAMALSGNASTSLGATGQSVEFTGAGGSSLRYGALLATDAQGQVLHSWLQLDGRELLIRVDARGARYPLRIDPLIDGQTLSTTPAGEGDLSGYSVALSADGNTALIGAPADHAHQAGVWMFTRSGPTWKQQGPELPIEEEEGGSGEQCTSENAECGFGRSVALSADGNTALVGAPTDHAHRGAVWVFTRSGGTWSRAVELTGGEGERDAGRFGAAVALSADGDIALVGAPADRVHHGAAWVFTRSGASWTQPGVEIPGWEEDGSAGFGRSVALSAAGDTALIGGRSDNGAIGAAWVFTSAGSAWRQQGSKLTGSDESGAARFGNSVALSALGNTALIGGPTDAGDAGAAWVFTRTGSTWQQQGPKLAADDELGEGRFGSSVALSGDGEVALIGAPHDGVAGAVWVFTRSGASWAQQGPKLESPPESSSAGDFGAGVALSTSGATALVGGPDYQNSAGAWTFLNTSVPTPTVSSVGPASGSSEGGTKVVVTGTGFLPGATVTIGGAASAVEVISETEIQALTPAHSTGLEEVAVTTADGESTGGPDYTYVRPAAPTVSSISPGVGSPFGGTKVIVTGTGFLPGATVAIGSAASAVEVISETEIRAVTPAHSPGPEEVVVTTVHGESAEGPDYIYGEPPPPPPPAPTVSSISPVSGSSVGGTKVLVNGTGFLAGATVTIGGAASGVEVVSETELKAVTPGHAAGPEEVVVTDTNGVSSGGPTYTFVAPPGVGTPITTALVGNPFANLGILSSQATAPPGPQLGVTGDLAPVSGTVLVKLPGSDAFVAVTGVREVPFGTIIDATHGMVTITTVGPHGKLQRMTFYSGEFELNQGSNGRVVAVLMGGNFGVCPTARERSHLARVSSSQASRKHVVRKLWANGHGSYSTKGNYAAGAVVGTRWLTEDLCDGTLIRVATDAVEVTNLVTHHRHKVTAGHQYLAKAP